MADESDTITAMKKILLLTRIESQTFTALKDCILPLAKDRDWAVHVFALGGMETTATNLIRTWNPDGCIVYAAGNSGLHGDFSRWRKPTVAINAGCQLCGIAAISHDSHETGRLAAMELASLGMDNFAFFSTSKRLSWVETRFNSFADEIRRLGRSVLRYANGPIGDWLAALPKPCGLFTANDLMAERAVAEAVARKINIPNEIAIISCDDNPQICEHAEVSISSIRPNFPRCAMLTVEALSCAMEGKPYTGDISYGDIGTTRRVSTRLIAGHPPHIAATLEHIRLHALDGISASDVIGMLGGSRRSAEGRFRKATGHSILEEIQAVRMAEVERLLANPSVKIGSIASRTGYRSENFLARLFKRTHGVTMHEFRQKVISQEHRQSAAAVPGMAADRLAASSPLAART